jgi:hypothetical protein
MAEQEKNDEVQVGETQDDLPVLTADDHLKHLLPLETATPWYVSVFQNLKDLIFPEKLPPLKLTSKPVAVKDIWGFYGGYKAKAGVSSILIHVSVVTLAFSLATNETVQKAVKETAISLVAPDLAPYIPQTPKAKPMGGGGGGGDRSPLPASKGRLPKLADQFL